MRNGGGGLVQKEGRRESTGSKRRDMMAYKSPVAD